MVSPNTVLWMLGGLSACWVGLFGALMTLGPDQREAAMTAAIDDLELEEDALVPGETTRAPADMLLDCGRALGHARPSFVVDRDAHGWTYDKARDVYLLWALQPTLGA